MIRNTAGALISVLLLILVLPLQLPVFGDWMQTVAEALRGSGAIYLLTDGAEGMTTTSSAAVLTLWASSLGKRCARHRLDSIRPCRRQPLTVSPDS